MAQGAASVIREATAQDMPLIVELGREMHARSVWRDYAAFDGTDFDNSAQRLIDDPDGAVFLSRRGMLWLSIVSLYFNSGVRIAAEMFFYAPDGRGDALRRAGERWARQSAQLIAMNAHGNTDPRARLLYERAGYAALEHSFLRAL